jgi:hypothetical protein
MEYAKNTIITTMGATIKSNKTDLGIISPGPYPLPPKLPPHPKNDKLMTLTATAQSRTTIKVFEFMFLSA